MRSEFSPVGGGRFVVPRNRWDLVSGWQARAAEVSVVIPYYRDQHLLELILAALTVQTIDRSKLQVVIADDGSPEPPIIPTFARCLDTTVVRQDDRGFRAAAARNLGSRAADGEVLAFLDGDTVPEPEYLQRLSRLPALLPDAVVTGRRRHAALRDWTAGQVLSWLAGERPAPDELTEPGWLIQEYRRSADLLQSGSRTFTFLIGAVLGCSATMVAEIGGFDESIVGYGGEDYDFTYRAFNAGAVLAHVPQAVAWHDGPDWSARIDDERQRRALKNREVVMLAQLIPAPTFRGRGQIYSSCDVVVLIDLTSWSLGATVVSVQSLLAELDCGVWLSGDQEMVADAHRALGSDPRIHLGDVPGTILARARAQLVVHRPVSAEADFGRRLSQLLEQDLGRLTITDSAVVLAVVTSTRASRRAARWAAHLEGDVVSDLFGAATSSAAEIGLAALPEEPDLSAVFGGWG